MFPKSLVTKTVLILSTALFSISSVSYGIMTNYAPEDRWQIGESGILTILEKGKKVEQIPLDKIEKNQLFANNKIVSMKNYEDLLSAFNEMGLLLSPQYYESSSNREFMYKGDVFNNSTTPSSDLINSTTSELKDISLGESKTYSETNSQVKGIDESDVLKTDGRYIYYVSNNTLRIVDTKDSTKIISSLNLSNQTNMTYREMYIVNDKLILIGTRIDSRIMPLSQDVSLSNKVIPDIYPYHGGKNYTTFAIYNVADRSHPKQERVIEIEGDSIATRLMGDTLYFVTNKWIGPVPYDKVESAQILPTYKDTLLSNETLTLPIKNIQYFPNSRDSQYMLTGAIDVTKSDPCIPQAYLGSGQTIYMSPESLYVIKPNYRDYSQTQTEIFRFAVNETTLEFVNACTINGQVLNQYSMDEYKGYFRIATGDSMGGNGIAVIDRNSMKLVGEISGLAVGESIYSVRFMGDVGYMVTFRQVDPLFIINLSDPKKPVKTGELKIPGFSQYLHPMGNKYLIGFGRQTEEFYIEDGKGGFVPSGQVRDVGFKLSLFDISDKYHPKEVHSKVYRETWSEASHNPRSIMVDAEKGIFAFPLERNTPLFDENGVSQDRKIFTGGTVVQVDPQKGFITMADLNKTDYSYENRFCYIDKKLYFLTHDKITVLDYTKYKVIEQIYF